MYRVYSCIIANSIPCAISIQNNKGGISVQISVEIHYLTVLIRLEKP